VYFARNRGSLAKALAAGSGPASVRLRVCCGVARAQLASRHARAVCQGMHRLTHETRTRDPHTRDLCCLRGKLQANFAWIGLCVSPAPQRRRIYHARVEVVFV
jgi:hypothetical protein